MNACLRLKPNSQGMVFDPRTGASYLFSPTGLEIINDWLNGKDDNAAAQSLAAKRASTMKPIARKPCIRIPMETSGNAGACDFGFEPCALGNKP